MSDNIPIEIQLIIVSKLPMKSVLQFRSVSKTWKSLVDSPNFVSAHTLRQTQPQHLLVSYLHQNYMSILDDDVTFPQQKSFPSAPLSVYQLDHTTIIGTSHGLFCFIGLTNSGSYLAVIWNPSIKKSVDVTVPNMLNVLNNKRYKSYIGFGVCPHTLDPKIVRISCIPNCREVEVFTLSSQIWRRALCSNNNVPRESIDFLTPQLALCGFIYWLAFDREYDTIRSNRTLIISFDLISEEFTEICLPNRLSSLPKYELSLSKRRESLVVFEYHIDRHSCAVWMMEPGVENVFKRLYTITVPPDACIDKVVGFRKNGAPIIHIWEDNMRVSKDELVLYDLDLGLINKIGIDGEQFSVFGYFYVETLLLLGQQ